MNRKVYDQAMSELEQLHEHIHLHVADGPDLWAGQILTMFRRAVDGEPAEDALDEEEETILLTAEPPQPVA